MGRYIFVGKHRSPRAIALDLHWVDGGLAAKPLFTALRALGLDPHAQTYVNVFNNDGTPDYEVIQLLKAHAQTVEPIVAMGGIVQAELQRRKIPYIKLAHPAAPGRIRKTEKYNTHVKEVLEK